MIKVYIHSRDGKVYKNDNVDLVYFTAKDVGDKGILPNSAPGIYLLDVSLIILKSNNTKINISTSGGILDFNNNLCSLYLDTFEFSDELDKEMILLKKKEAEALLKDKTKLNSKDLERAEFNLKKALNRLKLLK